MRVAYGPASTHVKSTMRSPASGLPADVGPAWCRSAGVGGGRVDRDPTRRAARRRRRPSPAAAAARGDGVPWNRANGPGMRTAVGARRRCGTMPRNAYCGFVATWATVCTSPKAMCRRWASWNSSPESLVRANRRIAFITRGMSASASSIDIFDSSSPSGSPSSAIHSNSGVGCGTGAMLHGPGLAVGHDVGARASAAIPGAARAGGSAAGRGTTTGRTGSRPTTVITSCSDRSTSAPWPVSRAACTPASPQMQAISEPNVEVLAAPRADRLLRRARRC